ncbi:hypothetical protein SUGI_0728320 [Cryptomeria japonica]|nr:hypothetical protein SUGI_0728320 [Cryptomeria japonica]
MAEDLYSLFFSRASTPEHDLDLASAVWLQNNNLDEENTQQLILHSEDAMKSRNNERIVFPEKMRRKKMGHLLSTLQSLLPVSTIAKLARRCIIEETGKYIQNLQSKAEELQKRKAQLLIEHNSSDIDVGIEIYSSEAVIIRISASRMPRSLCKIYQVVEEVGLEIERSDVYRGESIVFLYLHANVIASTSPHSLLQNSQTKTCLKETLQNTY